jgi:hypothetical protein
MLGTRWVKTKHLESLKKTMEKKDEKPVLPTLPPTAVPLFRSTTIGRVSGIKGEYKSKES